MIAIPAIDILDMQIVRLYQGKYTEQTNYDLDPVHYARKIEESGLEYLHLVDLSGARTGQIVHAELMKEIALKTGLKVDFGGGIKTREDVVSLLEMGANQVVIGSLCVRDPELVRSWINEFGTKRFILALDTDGTSLKIHGWQENTGISLEELMRYFESFKALTILTTDIRKDGTGSGPNVPMYRSLIEKFPNQRWVASGGVRNSSDLQELRAVGCYGCVVGKALLEGDITLATLKFFNDAGV